MTYSIGKAAKTYLRTSPIGAAGLMAVDKLTHPNKSGSQIVKDNFLLNPLESAGALSKDLGVTKKDPVKSTNVGQLAADILTAVDPVTLAGKAIPQGIAGGPTSAAKIAAERTSQNVGTTTSLVKCGVGGTLAAGGKTVETVLGLPPSTSKYALIGLAGLGGAYASRKILDLPFPGPAFIGIVSSYAAYSYYPEWKGDCEPLLWNPKTKESKTLGSRNVKMTAEATKKVVVFSAYTAALFVLMAVARKQIMQRRGVVASLPVA